MPGIWTGQVSFCCLKCRNSGHLLGEIQRNDRLTVRGNATWTLGRDTRLLVRGSVAGRVTGAAQANLDEQCHSERKQEYRHIASVSTRSPVFQRPRSCLIENNMEQDSRAYGDSCKSAKTPRTDPPYAVNSIQKSNNTQRYANSYDSERYRGRGQNNFHHLLAL